VPFSRGGSGLLGTSADVRRRARGRRADYLEEDEDTWHDQDPGVARG
jgi:hypothetical protein